MLKIFAAADPLKNDMKVFAGAGAAAIGGVAVAEAVNVAEVAEVAETSRVKILLVSGGGSSDSS